MEKDAKNNERTIIFEDEDDDLFVMKGFFDDPHYKSIYESIIKERPIVIEKAELPDTKNNIPPENIPYSEFEGLILKGLETNIKELLGIDGQMSLLLSSMEEEQEK